MMSRTDIDRMTGTARDMAEAQREAQEAATKNFMSMQQRSMQVARDGLKFIELQQDTMGAAQDFWSSGMRLMSIQQRNAEFAQRWVSGAADAVRGQAEQNVRTAEVFARSARAQQENFRSLTRMWFGAYRDFVSPFADYAQESIKVAQQATEQGAEMTKQATEQGMRLVDNAADTTAKAVRENENRGVLVTALESGAYDEMNVGDITARLDGLTEDELKKVHAYEKRNQNRETLVEQIDRKIKAAS